MNSEHGDRTPVAEIGRKIYRSKLVTIGFLVVIAYFLWTEHRAHVIQFLPFLLLASCPLMHLFMHHGHGRGHDQGSEGASNGKDVKGEQ